MYSSLIKPLLFRLPAETAHHLAFGALRAAHAIPGVKAVLRARFAPREPALEVAALGLRFPSPILLAAGFDNRLHPLTNATPPAALPVANTPLARRSLDYLHAQGVGEVIVNTYRLAHTVEAICQTAPVFFDKARTIDKACAGIAEAAKNGAELVVFSEAFIAGYPYWGEGWESPVDRWIGTRVRFYDNGRSENPNVSNARRRTGRDGVARLDRNFQRVDDMSEDEMQDIIAFLGALTDSDFDRTIPARVPSGLPPGGAIR